MSDTCEQHPSYQLGEFVLDVDRGCLLHKGVEIPLRPRSFEVLRYLAEHPGRLFSREELMDALWHGTVVTEDAVTQCLMDIRRALGDANQEMIRTVPRRGYRLDLPVTQISPTGSGSDNSDKGSRTPVRAILGAVVVLAAVAGVAALLLGRNPPDSGTIPAEATIATPSIAVLPFANMGPDPQETYFADGVSEEIINSLARQKGLKVIARTSSFSFRDLDYDVNTIASRLDVSHVLEGSVRNDGDALRINVQLVDAGSGEYVWNEQFDRELSAASVFAIQTEIATAVVESLQNELTPQERARLVRVPTENLEALNAYFEARQAMESRRPNELDRAGELLRRVIELDENFALAYVALAETLRLQSNYGNLPRGVADEQGITAVRKALALDDGLGQAYASLGNILARNADVAGAEEAFLRGIELTPSYAPLFQWYGQYLHIFAARPDEAPTYARIAVALDPRSAIINADYAGALMSAGRYGEALDQIDHIIDFDPDFARAYDDKAVLLHGVYGRIAEAVPLAEQARQRAPDWFGGPISLAHAYMDLGDFDVAAEFIAESERKAPGNPWVGEIKVMLKAITADTAAATAAAQAVLARLPWDVRPLRHLRDEALAAGDVDQAIAYYLPTFATFFGEDPPAINPSNYAAAIDASYLLALSGRRQRAERILGKCVKFLDRPRQSWFGTPIADVKVQAILGNDEIALDLLRAAVDEGWRESWRFELLHDRALARLADTPEFTAIVEVLENDMAEQRQRLVESR